MSHSTKPDKKVSQLPKTSGRFASPEEAALYKNAELIAHIKKIGLKIIKTDPSSK